ncbi:MAG: DUF2341 domain-containing protein, partial [Candidatus Bathyarchaeota archaeon]|nr:DUF2341 domain-containing protein [Candidatus Bathyarchaeota archaeon]
MNEGLVSYYALDAGHGDMAYDSSGRGNDGAIVGASWTAGRYQKGLSFDAVADYVDCGTLGDFGSTALRDATTYAFWLNTSQTGSSRVMGTVNNGYTTALAIELNIPETDKVGFFLRDNETKVLSGSIKETFDFTGTGWHHFAFIVDARNNTISLYIDGLPKAVTYTQEESPDAFSDFDYSFVIGAWNRWRSVESFFEGMIDEVRIYNRALAIGEVKSLASVRHIIIDQSFVSDERADLGSTQTIGFHARWGHNGSDAVGSTIHIERQRRNVDDAYYTREISITEMSGNYLLDYPVLVELDTATLISEGKMRSDGADIKVKDSDGETDLSFWIEAGLNTSATRIWVKVPFIPGSSTKRISLHYGNASSDPASNIKTTFLLGDDFEDGVLDTNIWTWIREPQGNWDEGVSAPGWLTIKTVDGDISGWPDGSVLRSNFDFANQDYEAVVQVRISPTEDFHQANLLVYSDDRHHLRLSRGHNSDQRIEFALRNGDSPKPNPISTTATDLLLKITKVGTTYSGLASSGPGETWDKICEYTNVSLKSNYIALMSSRDHYVGAPLIDTYYDNFRVRRLVLPEPLVFVAEEDSMLEVETVEHTTNSTGWVTLSVSSLNLGKEFWTVSGVDAGDANTFYREAQDPFTVWDQVSVTLIADGDRIDTGKAVDISYEGTYLFDGETFEGTISLNDPVLKHDTVGLRTYRVAGIMDYRYGLTAFSSNEVQVIWDRVNISLSIPNPRISVGSEANITWAGFYEYDGDTFSGSVLLNNTQTKDATGECCYTVASIVDPIHNLTAYAANGVQCIFDDIEASYGFETLTPGSVRVSVNLNDEYDGSPVEDAEVRVNGVEAENAGSGIYEAKVSSWMPFVTINTELERAGYELVATETIVFPLGT